MYPCICRSQLITYTLFYWCDCSLNWVERKQNLNLLVSFVSSPSYELIKNGISSLTTLVSPYQFLWEKWYAGRLGQNYSILKSPIFQFLNVSYVSSSRSICPKFKSKYPTVVYIHMDMVIWLKIMNWDSKIKMYHFDLSINCVKCIISLVKDYAMLQYSFSLEISLAERHTYLYSKKLNFTMLL